MKFVNYIILVIDNCLSSPCTGKAICYNSVDGYSCCSAGYEGNNCIIGLLLLILNTPNFI